jgi:hypothetical protein
MNIIEFPNNDELKAALETLKRDLPTFLEYQAVIAKIKRAQYDALIEAGFSPEQALELCKGSLTI